jgi:hypothetical protein
MKMDIKCTTAPTDLWAFLHGGRENVESRNAASSLRPASNATLSSSSPAGENKKGAEGARTRFLADIGARLGNCCSGTTQIAKDVMSLSTERRHATL